MSILNEVESDIKLAILIIQKSLKKDPIKSDELI